LVPVKILGGVASIPVTWFDFAGGAHTTVGFAESVGSFSTASELRVIQVRPGWKRNSKKKNKKFEIVI
jgi:hypothetical protein